jgi:HD-GYP domain-containing protein (c-di-GMP phosphodiesterase class II)
MLRLSLGDLKPGLVVARDIYGANERLLLGNNITLDERLITKLAMMNIDSVCVKNNYIGNEPSEILSEKTRATIIKVTRQCFDAFRTQEVLNIDDIKQAITMLVDDVIDYRQDLIHLTLILTCDYIYCHSINACLIASVIGHQLQLHKTQLQELALGVILHDIGNILLPTDILNSKHKLTATEWEILKSHAEKGFAILRKQSTNIPLMSAHVAFQHHENFDGTGYPRGLKGEEIHLYARIAAIADMYAAVTADRPYRPPMLPHEAYEVVIGSRGTKLDPNMADIFFKHVALFPIGTVVQLDSGEICLVIKVYPTLQTRPILQVMLDTTGRRVMRAQVIDLTRELTRFVVKVFKPVDVIALPTS